jgi:hypothetical protein
MRSVIRNRIAEHLEGLTARQALREAERAAKLSANRERGRQYSREARAGVPPKASPLFKKAGQD